MYNRQVLIWQPGGVYWNPANGTVYFQDISLPGGPKSVMVRITTPWGYIADTFFDEGQCQLWSQTLYSPFRVYVYIVKVVSINPITGGGSADFQVLSYVYDESVFRDPITGLNQLIVNENLPDRVLPGTTVNYDYKITNNSSTGAYLRYIFATNINAFPMIYASSQTDCDKPLPPILNTSKKCWYDDWITGTQVCQPITVGAGITNLPLFSGSITIPSSGSEMFTLGIFVEVLNYWGAGKTEWVAPSGYQQGWQNSVLSDICTGVSCPNICVYNPATGMYDLWSQKCNTTTGQCELDTKISPGDIKCTATHYLDFYVKPHSWYSPDGAAAQILTLVSDISGAIINTLTDLGITTWTYLGIDIITETDRVIIRIYLKEVSSLYHAGHQEPTIKSLVGPWVFIGIAIGVVIIGIGIITGYLLYRAGIQLLGETYTKSQVGQLLNDILDKTIDNCKKNFPNDPAGYANCVKSGVESVTGAGGDFFKDPTITQSGTDASTKIDDCIAKYNAGEIDAAGLDACVKGAVDPVKNTITNQTKDKGFGALGGLLLIGAGLAALYIFTRPFEKAAPAVVKILAEERRK